MAETFRTSGMEQILAKLTSANPSQTIYTPETGTDGEGNPLPFFAYIDTLRAKIKLPSLAEAVLPEGFDELDGLGQRAALKQIMFVESHVLIELVMEKDGLEVVPATIGGINRPPFYQFSFMSFLTDAATFPIAAGTTLKARVVNDGWGGLAPGDSIEIFGSARTEAPSFSAPPQQVIVTGTTGGGNTGGGGDSLPANLVTFNGDPVTFNGDYVVLTP